LYYRSDVLALDVHYVVTNLVHLVSRATAGPVNREGVAKCLALPLATVFPATSVVPRPSYAHIDVYGGADENEGIKADFVQSVSVRDNIAVGVEAYEKSTLKRAGIICDLSPSLRVGDLVCFVGTKRDKASARNFGP
jgi:hypothetical protein